MNDHPTGRWPRDLWLDAIWECPEVKPNERVVAYTYARYAGAGEVAWCSWDELRRRTGVRSRDAISRALAGLIEAGWLVEVERARQHYSARYRLTTPPQWSGKRTTEGCQQSGKQTAGPESGASGDTASSPFPETSSPFPETSSPFPGPDLSNGLLEHSPQTSGGTLPPDPLRTQDLRSSGLGTDQSTDGSVVTDPPTQVDQSSPVPPRRCAHGLATGMRPDRTPRCALCRRDALRAAS